MRRKRAMELIEHESESEMKDMEKYAYQLNLYVEKSRSKSRSRDKSRDMSRGTDEKVKGVSRK